jgi:carbonic anhydrase
MFVNTKFFIRVNKLLHLCYLTITLDCERSILRTYQYLKRKNYMVPSPDITPDLALKILKEGNARFVSDRLEHPHSGMLRRNETSRGQHPIAAIVACSDSRVPPEIIFDRGIGDLFVVRVAGNILEPAGLGSLVYAVGHLGCPLIVVMGHESCGAVKVSLVPDAELIHEPVSVIRIAEMIRENIPETLSGRSKIVDITTAAVKENASSVAEQILNEPFLEQKAKEGAVSVKRAYYSFSTGVVSWL